MRELLRLTIAGAVLLIMFFAIGCSSGTSPLDPGTTGPAYVPQGENKGGALLWGVWNIVIDTETETADITQVRLADDCLNVLSFLEPPALANMNIANLQLLPGQSKVNVDILLKHPFITNGEFHGFDVKGVVFGPELLNEDGKTAWMNPGDFRNVGFGYQDGLLGVPYSTAHYSGTNWGYKYFADGLGKNTSLVTFFSNSANLNNRGIFTEGSTNTRHYQLDFQTPSKFLVFNYAIIANYDWPTGSPPYTKNDFPIATANGQEAFCLNATEISNTLWHDPNAGIGGGIVSLDVEVWDWQGLGNTSVRMTGGGGTPTTQSSYTGGSTSYSGIFSFVNLSYSPSSTNPITFTFTATDSSASFGSTWFMGLLPASNSMYSTSVYTIIKKLVNVATAGNYYNNTSIKDFVLWKYPHQSPNCCFGFVDYYNFTGPPYGRHDLCVIPAHNFVKVIDTVGYGAGGAPPWGGGIIYDIPLPLGIGAEIPAPYFSGPGSPPNLFPPWEPTRFDSNSYEFEMAICSANPFPYFFSPWWPPLSPEYSIQQIYHVPPGAGGPPFLLDVEPPTMFGGLPWDIGVDVTNGFYDSTNSTFGPLYGLFFFDYSICGVCGFPPPPAPPPGICWVYELPLPAVPGVISPVALPTSVGAGAPGPKVIDDSSQYGVCGSLAADSQPFNQAGLTLGTPTLMYILDSEGDIEIFEADFTNGQQAQYGVISAGSMGGGYMAADIEMIDTNKLGALGLPGYVPNTNILAVAMVDGNVGSSQGDWWVDIYIINPGTDTSVIHASTPVNTGQPFLAIDVDETTGEIYVLHGSNSTQGSTAITVYKYL